MPQAATAASKCDKIVSRASVFNNILLKTPELTPQDLERIINSPHPIDPFAETPRGPELHSARKALNWIISKLKKGEWDTIRELARNSLANLQGTNQKVEEAKALTASIPQQKRLFSFEAAGGSSQHYSTLHSQDGRTYFAHHDSDKRIRIHNDNGKLIWTSSAKINPYHVPWASGSLPPLIALLENKNGEKRVEYYTEESINGDTHIITNTFALSSASTTASITRKLNCKSTSNKQLIFVINLPSGKQLFVRQATFDGPVEIRMSDRSAHEIKGHVTPENFAEHPDGSILIATYGKDSAIYRIANTGELEKVTKLKNLDLPGRLIIRSNGKVAADLNRYSKITSDARAKPLPSKNLPPVTDFAMGDLLETPDGNLLFARAGHWRGARVDGDLALYDLTSGATPIALKEPQGHGTFGLKLANTIAGPLLILLTLDHVEMQIIGPNGGYIIGDIKIKTGDGEKQIITHDSEAFLINSTKVEPGHAENTYDVYKIYGRD